MKCQQNKIWIGTYDKGLILFENDNFQTFNTTNSEIPSNYVCDIEIDSNQKIWMVSGTSLARFSNGFWSKFDSNNTAFLRNKSISENIGIDKNNRVVVDTYEGVWSDHFINLFDGITVKTLKTMNRDNWQQGVNKIKTDKNGYTWIGYNSFYYKNRGLCIVLADTVRCFNTTNSSFPKNSCTTEDHPNDDVIDFDFDRNGDIWLASATAGLIVYKNNYKTGINEVSPIETFDIWPNPANDLINFSFIPKVNSVFSCYDISGREVFSTPISSNETNVSSLPKGFYIVKISQNNKAIATSKLIKQ